MKLLQKPSLHFKTALMAVGIASLSSFAQAQTVPTPTVGSWDWTRKATGCSYDRTNALHNDGAGNIYAVGSFHDTAHFNNMPGFAGKRLTSNGGRDGFLAKYNESGKMLWMTNMGGTLEDEAWDVTATSSAIYVVGYFQGTMTLKSAAGSGGSNSTLTSAGSRDAFLACYSNTGALITAIKAGSTGSDEAWSVALSTNNRLYIGGSFEKTVAFKGASGNSISLTSAGWGDGFVIELNTSTGVLAYASRIGGLGNDIVYGVTATGGVPYVCGSFQRSATTAGASATLTLNSAGEDDAFVGALNSTGKFSWINRFGSTKSEVARRLTPGTNSTINMVGYFNSPSIAFGSKTITSAGNYDALAVQYRINGTFNWASRFGGLQDDEGRDINTDASGNTYVVGSFQGASKDMNNYGRTSLGNKDIFAWKINSTGQSLFFERAGGTNEDQGRCVALSGSGIVLGGTYFRKAIFGASGQADYTECGNGGAFISKVVPAYGSSREGLEDEVAVMTMEVLSVSLFPNPAIGTVNVELSGTYEAATVRFYDSQGHNVLEASAEPDTRTTLNVSALPRGLYLVEVGDQRKRLILQ